MKGRVAQVTLIVKDQTAALEFYTRKAGFEKKTDFSPPGYPRWVTVGLPGQEFELALFQMGSKSDPRYPSDHWKPGNGPAIVLRVEDCRATFAELKSRGVRFMEDAPGEYPWGIAATFFDPDGNSFSLLQPPAHPSR